MLRRWLLMAVPAVLAVSVVPLSTTHAQQGSVAGIVRDSSGKAVAHAILRLRRNALVTRSDSTGRFLIKDVPVGADTLEIRALGYAHGLQPIVVSNGQTTDLAITLAPGSQNLAEVAAVGSVAGPRSPWVGARAVMSFSGADNADDFQASGQARLEVLGKPKHRGGAYVMGNISRLNANPATDDEATAETVKLRELQQSTQGVQFAVVPHAFWGDSVHESATLFASLGYKLNALKDTTSQTAYLNQFVVGVGVSFTFLQGMQAGLPVELTFGPTITFLKAADYEAVFRESRSKLASLEGTLVVPAGKGIGILTEGTLPFGKDKPNAGKPDFRVGLILAPMK